MLESQLLGCVRAPLGSRGELGLDGSALEEVLGHEGLLLETNGRGPVLMLGETPLSDGTLVYYNGQRQGDRASSISEDI
jgi:hypothetical protein